MLLRWNSIYSSLPFTENQIQFVSSISFCDTFVTAHSAPMEFAEFGHEYRLMQRSGDSPRKVISSQTSDWIGQRCTMRCDTIHSHLGSLGVK
jgi:hypothetical protein